MNEKKRDKRLANANAVWERAQLRAATAAEQIDKALAAVEQYRDELTDEQIMDIKEQVERQREEIKDYLVKERNKFADKLDLLQVEAVIADDKPRVLVNLEDL